MISRKSSNIQKLNNTLLENLQIKEEIKKEIKPYFKLKENKTQHIKICGILLKQHLEGNLQRKTLKKNKIGELTLPDFKT